MDFSNHLEHVKETDPEVYNIILKEIERQETTLELIPSETITSFATMEAQGSVLVNKYSEGYPKKRYYGGNEYIDEVEILAQERAKKLFNVEHVNVQPYSGSPANLAVYVATCEPGDTTMGHGLTDGGHLTHGWSVNATGKFFNSVLYGVKEDGVIDIDQVRELAEKHKPKLIWMGATAYPREIPFKEFAEIADSVGAYLAADMSHISGLIVGGAHPSPVEYAHIITTTTHKTLRGPRGGMIMVTQKGLDKDPDLAKKVDKAIFPGLQGGPHDHQTAAIAVTLGEAFKPEFKEYAHQVVKNSRALAKVLINNGVEVISGGSDNHLILYKCGTGRGIFAQEALDEAGITTNKNTIPKDPASPFYPSGVRIGTPIMTVRGMKEEQMEVVGKWLAEVNQITSEYNLPDDKKERREYIKNFRKEIKAHPRLKEIREEVRKLCEAFPAYTR